MSSGNSTVTDTTLSITSETTTEITTTTTISTTTTTTTTTTTESTTSTTSTTEPTSTTSTTTSSTTDSETSTQPPTTTSSTASETPESETETETSTNDPATVTVTVTSTNTPTTDPTDTNSLTTSATTTAPTPGETGGSNNGSVSKGISGPAVIAIGVIVPVVILAVVGIVLFIYFKKRKNRHNGSPKGFAGGGMIGGGAPPPDGGRDGTFEMNETDSAGYRGWGSTAGGRKTTVAGSGYPMSSVGKAVSDGGYSNPASAGPPGYPGNVNEMYSGMNVPTSPTYPDSTGLLAMDRAVPSPAFTETSTIGAMPTFDSNNSGGLNRGVSNASSNYSTMSHSDQSDFDHRQSQRYYGADAQDYDAAYFSNGPTMYYDESSNPPPVIRDVQARRNTRIETPTSAHFPQQGSSGIAQNF